MEGNPTGCRGLADDLGRKWKLKANIPIVCVPGCPVQLDNLLETFLYLLHMATGKAPMIPFAEALWATWLFGQTVHEGCDRGGYYEQAEFAVEYGAIRSFVQLGCRGRLSNATWGNAVGGQGLVVARMPEGFASAARCPTFRINLCLS